MKKIENPKESKKIQRLENRLEKIIENFPDKQIRIAEYTIRTPQDFVDFLTSEYVSCPFRTICDLWSPNFPKKAIICNSTEWKYCSYFINNFVDPVLDSLEKDELKQPSDIIVSLARYQQKLK